MIIKCNSKWQKRTLSYIEKEYEVCLYLYADIHRYGFSSNSIKVWIDLNKNSEITAVIMKYYDGMHIFSKSKQLNIKQIVELIETEGPYSINSEKSIIDKLNKYLKGRYLNSFGKAGFLDIRKSIQDNNKIDYEVRLASREDYSLMAKMIMEDEGLGGGHTYAELLRQIKDRNSEGYSRSFLMFQQDKLIAQASTNAEDEELVILSNVIVNKNFRRKGIGSEMVKHVYEYFNSQDKKVYLYCYAKPAFKMYRKLGTVFYCDWGKLYIKRSKV